MPVLTFLGAIITSLLLIKVAVELPLGSLYWLDIPNWVGIAIFLGFLSWCMGD